MSAESVQGIFFNTLFLFQRLPEKIREKDEKLKAEMMGKNNFIFFEESFSEDSKKNIKFVLALFSICVYLDVFPIAKAMD